MPFGTVAIVTNTSAAPPPPSCASAIIIRSPDWKSFPLLIAVTLEIAPLLSITTVNVAALPSLSVVHVSTAVYVPAVLSASGCAVNVNVAIELGPNTKPSNSESR